jgi:membrane protease YdiL (CAAX protease family)
MMAAPIGYAVLLGAFWLAARHFATARDLRSHFLSTFGAFALIFAAYWFFGFGADEVLRRWLKNRAARALSPGLLVVPYLLCALPRGQFHWTNMSVVLLVPVVMAALFEFVPPRTQGLSWQDVAVLALAGLPVELGWAGRVFFTPGLSALPKLLLVDAVLYAFLVVRRSHGVGYDFRLRSGDLVIGLREFGFFAPIAVVIGMGVQFITPHRTIPSALSIFGTLLVTFFFVAIPEELFFRGLLQNLLEQRLGYRNSLAVASVIFGLSHFNKPMAFNFRYVLLATIAGVFYGRAWHNRGRVLASAITHTLVDVIWSLWFR